LKLRIRHGHLFMLHYSKSLFLRILTRPAFLFLGALTLSAMAFFSVLIHRVEAGSGNPVFESYLNSAYFTVSTMTSVGMAGMEPMSTAGRIIAMLMMMIGTFLFVSFTGVVATTVLELELEIKSDPSQ
jgi:voltage-gated potassium channel